MKGKFISFDELTDSWELLEAQPPRIMAYFIYLILLMVFIAFIWMWLGKIEVVVKAQGVIRPAANISIVRNSASGKIKEVRFPHGGRVSKGELLFRFDSESLEIEKKNLQRELEESETNLKGFILLRESLTSNKDLIPKTNIEFYNRYLRYQIGKKKLELALIKAETGFKNESKLPPTMISSEKLEESKRNYQLSKLNLEAFENENSLSIEEQIQGLTLKTNDLSGQIQQIRFRLENSNVSSPISGTIQEIGTYNVGDFVPANTDLLRIIPEGSKKLKVDLFVNNKDIANVKKGAVIHYSFSALPPREYGYLTGSVIKIPGDVQFQGGKSDGFFVVGGSINKTELKGRRKRAKVKTGMLCEGRITVRTQRIIDFVLEKLDFKS